MPYVGPDGTIHQSRPWGVGMVSDFFWGILNFVYAFFTTLIRPGKDNSASGTGRGSGSGGPGGPGGPGGRRRMGGVTTIQDCSMPGGG